MLNVVEFDLSSLSYAVATGYSTCLSEVISLVGMPQLQNLKGCSFVSLMDFVVKKKWESFSMIWSLQTKLSFYFIFLYNFANWVRVYREVHILSFIDFTDWLLVE